MNTDTDFDTEELRNFYLSNRRFRQLSDFLNCDVLIVGRAFEKHPNPTELTRASMDEHSLSADELKRARIYCQKLVDVIEKLPSVLVGAIELDSGLDVETLRATKNKLKAWEETVEHWSIKRPRTGGREPAAEVILSALAEIFDEIQEPVTFGAKEEGSDPASFEPSTNFCRAVKEAFYIYELKTNWRSVSADFCKQRKNQNLQK